jgi:uncharacterized Zn finger protein (UPF0148 family)
MFEIVCPKCHGVDFKSDAGDYCIACEVMEMTPEQVRESLERNGVDVDAFTRRLRERIAALGVK